MKEYNHLLNYLHRWTVCKIGSLHIRIHHILSSDGTPFLHNHPFWYVSVIVRGGYTEQVLVGDEIKMIEHCAPAVILRKPSTYHRIISVQGACKTLFVTWLSEGWNLVRHKAVVAPQSYKVPVCEGVYIRTINNTRVYSKFSRGMWFVGSEDRQMAVAATKLSVHQCTKWVEE